MKYMLVFVHERNIVTTLHPSFAEARKAMLEGLHEEFERFEDSFDQDWETILKENPEKFECAEFEYSKTSAWSNIDEDCKCDWEIVEIPEEKPVIPNIAISKRAKKFLWLMVGVSTKHTVAEFNEMGFFTKKGNEILRRKLESGAFMLEGEEWPQDGGSGVEIISYIPVKLTVDEFACVTSKKRGNKILRQKLLLGEYSLEYTVGKGESLWFRAEKPVMLTADEVHEVISETAKGKKILREKLNARRKKNKNTSADEEKSLWLRAGVSVKLTAAQFSKVEAQTEEGEDILRQKLTSGDFELDGETYAPSNVGYLPSHNWIPEEELEFIF